MRIASLVPSATEMLFALGLGGDVVASGLAETAVRRGGHLRVGLEDLSVGPRTPTNRELVDEAVALLTSLGRRPATPAEARAILGVPAR